MEERKEVGEEAMKAAALEVEVKVVEEGAKSE